MRLRKIVCNKQKKKNTNVTYIVIRVICIYAVNNLVETNFSHKAEIRLSRKRFMALAKELAFCLFIQIKRKSV